MTNSGFKISTPIQNLNKFVLNTTNISSNVQNEVDALQNEMGNIENALENVNTQIMDNQEANPVHLGYQSGYVNQSTNSTAMGIFSGHENQQPFGVAMGYQAGFFNQGEQSVALGFQAGFLNQGKQSIAIGCQAGRNNQHAHTIVLNATDEPLNTRREVGLYINPIRPAFIYEEDDSNNFILSYNTFLSEIVHGYVYEGQLDGVLQDSLNLHTDTQSDLPGSYKVRYCRNNSFNYNPRPLNFNLILSADDARGSGTFDYTANVLPLNTASIFMGLTISLADVAQTWIDKDIIRNWKDVAISFSGQYQTAIVNPSGYIYVSNDYGENWSEKSIETNWTTIAMSASGKYQSVGNENGSIYISRDFGESWEEIAIGQGGMISSITMIANGTTQFCIQDTLFEGLPFKNIFISLDYGKTWTEKSFPDYPPDGDLVPLYSAMGITTNADGSKTISILEQYGFPSSYLYITENNFYSIAKETNMEDIITRADKLTSISTSLQSEYIIFTSSDYGAYVSDDFCVTISNIVDIGVNATCSCISASGQYQVIGVNNDYLYVSEDYGHTWTPRGTIEEWTGVSISSSGQYIVAVAKNSTIKLSLNSAK